MSEIHIRNTGISRPFPISAADNSLIEFGGSKLTEHNSFDTEAGMDAGRDLGLLLAIPQLPPWLTGQFADVHAASKTGGPSLDEYTVEWFERLVYIHSSDAQEIVDGPDQLKRAEVLGVVAGDLALQSEFSLGCAKTAPLVSLYRFKPGTGVQKQPGRYHALIEDFMDPQTNKVVKKMRVVPVGQNLVESLKKFVGSKKHAELKLLHLDDTGTVAADLKQRTLAAIHEI